MSNTPEPLVPSKRRFQYRITKASLPWLVGFFLLVPYEIYCVARGIDGGPLTHVVKWCYGEPRSLRWWLLGFGNSGFLLWMVPHFLFEGWGLNRLLTLVGIGLVVGVVGYLITK